MRKPVPELDALVQIPLPPPTLAAGTFLLRRIGPGDEELEQALSRCPDVVTWTYYPPDLSADQARERVLRTQARAVEGIAARYVVELDGHALGTAGIKNSDDAPEVFYALLPAGRGQGAATAAAVALSDWALEHGAPYVALWTLPGNFASEGVAWRAGFSSADDDNADDEADDESAGPGAEADGADAKASGYESDASYGPNAGDAAGDESFAGPRLWTRFTD